MLGGALIAFFSVISYFIVSLFIYSLEACPSIQFVLLVLIPLTILIIEVLILNFSRTISNKLGDLHSTFKEDLESFRNLEQ